MVLDRRFDCRTIRTMPGAKGSVRDLIVFGDKDKEFLIAVGCDRYLRVYDPEMEHQHQTLCGSAYLK